jgi:ATP synthase protein I
MTSPSPEPRKPPPAEPDGMADSVRRERLRQGQWLREGEPSMARFVGQIGVLGWMMVIPTLLGLFIGRWLDKHFETGVFFSAPLLMLGAGLGFWSAWKWMHRQ